MKIILASGSPRRKEILKNLGLNFDIIKPSIEEISSKTNPESYVKDLAYKKGLSVCHEVLDKEILIISADTIVSLEDKILEKPKTEEEAYRMLSHLSGKKHQVYTAVCFFHHDVYSLFSEKTDVYFKKLTRKDILHYIKTGEPMDKAGAYGIQGKGEFLVEKINGSFSNVVGLPISRIFDELKNFLKEESPLKF